MPAIKNQYTSAPAEESLAKVQRLLVSKGVASLSVHFEDGEPAGLDFLVLIDRADGRKAPVPFRLPANVDGVERILKRVPRRDVQGRPHARAVAWANVVLWLEAQFALIEAGQAALHQVFLPYAVGPDGRTLFEHFESDPSRLLGA